MASVRHARDAGRSSKYHSGSIRSPFDTGDTAVRRINKTQQTALDDMFHRNAEVRAAVSVLHSALLGGGLRLERDGDVLEEVRFGDKSSDGKRKRGITVDWGRHLQEHWLPFARDVVDAFLKWGVCPVAVVPLVDNRVALRDALRDVRQKDSTGAPRERAPIVEKTRAAKPTKATVYVPCVPHTGTYQLGFRPTGPSGYQREYLLYPATQLSSLDPDPTATVFVRQHPDEHGNICSPLASVHDMGSFVGSLRELALDAEIARSQPMITTQLRRPDRGADLSAGSLFFDSESRAMASTQESDESTAAARALEVQARLCDIMCVLSAHSHSFACSEGTDPRIVS